MEVVITKYGDNYIKGIVGKCRFDARVFDDNSRYGIDGGRVSKLTVYDSESEHCIINYDRGWDIPVDDEYTEYFEVIMDLLESKAF